MDDQVNGEILPEQAQQISAMEQFLKTSELFQSLPAVRAMAFSMFVAPDGVVLLAYGEQLHQSLPPKFHGILALTEGAAEGLANALQGVVDKMKEVRSAHDASRPN